MGHSDRQIYGLAGAVILRCRSDARRYFHTIASGRELRMRRRDFLQANVALAAAALPASVKAALPATAVDVVVSPGNVVGNLPHIWEECAGSDRAATTLREAWHQDLDHWR